jgi:hypothetical protein
MQIINAKSDKHSLSEKFEGGNDNEWLKTVKFCMW